MNTMQNKDIFNPETWTDKDRQFLDMAIRMTPKQLDLALTIIDMTTGHPDRREVALNWTGKMEDLPAALARI